MTNITHWNALLATVAVCTLSACSAGSDKPVAPRAAGTVSLTLVRSTTSQIPLWAESAFVRVRNPALAVDIVRPVAIPTPGASTTLDVSVPVGTGYSVTVVAFHDLHDGIRVAPSAGETSGITVTPGANAVAVSVVPWTYTLSGPDTIRSGEPATYTLTLTGGPLDFMTNQIAFHYKIGWNTQDIRFDFARNGASAAATFTIPPMSTDTTVYFTYSYFLDDAAFQTHSLSFAADMPILFDPTLNTDGSLSFHRPVKAAAGDIAVTFSKEHEVRQR
jgi:hypothetical protein